MSTPVIGQSSGAQMPAEETLMGAAATLRESTGAGMDAEVALRHEAMLEALRATIGATTFRDAWDRGSRMDMEEMITAAMNLDPLWIAPPQAGGGSPSRPADQTPARRHAEGAEVPQQPDPAGEAAPAATLTARELDVLRLVADGLPDAEIGEKLFISTRTVNAHLRSIYAKLDVSSRKEAARVATSMGLV